MTAIFVFNTVQVKYLSSYGAYSFGNLSIVLLLDAADHGSETQIRAGKK